MLVILKTCMNLLRKKRKQLVNVQSRTSLPSEKEPKSHKSDTHAKKLIQVQSFNMVMLTHENSIVYGPI